MTAILGFSAYHGDASAALVVDGQLVAAVEEERFRRVKHWAGFPSDAIRACLAMGGLEPSDVDHFAIARDPRANFLRKLSFALSKRPSVALLSDRVRNASRASGVASTLAETLGLSSEWVNERLHLIEHHPAHLASAFFVSPFDEAAACSIDGFGDFVSTAFAAGRGGRLDVFDRVFFPHSLGLVYLAVTQFLGFPKYGDEFKVMGLAPYGAPDFVREIRQLVYLEPEGRFEVDLRYFRHWSEGLSMSWENGEPTQGTAYTEALEKLLGPARRPDDPLEPRHEAIAASLQEVFEEAVFHVLRGLHRRTGLTRLCLAGGCAMNGVANGKLRRETPFEEVYVQPAAADNGTALGAAFYVWNQLLGRPRSFVLDHAFWGPEFSADAIRRALDERQTELARADCQPRRIEDEDALTAWAAARLADGRVIGWFQGRMEWGARALGNRSILADPRRADMREILNTKIKLREKFRPFAPSVLEHALSEYFVGAKPDPFMLHVYPVHPDKRRVIPAVTHVDGSGRLQTVSALSNPRYFRLLRAFEARTGVPVLLNTSFNENEPIVLEPAEAIDCFLRTGMDGLVLGDVVLEKERVEDSSREPVNAPQSRAPVPFV